MPAPESMLQMSTPQSPSLLTCCMHRVMIAMAALFLGAVLANGPVDAWEDFAHEEQRMLTVLQQARLELPQELFAALLSQQAAWYEWRDVKARDAAQLMSQTDIFEEEYWWNLHHDTRVRTQYLEASLFTHSPEAAGLGDWEGYWVDGDGGFITITEPEPGLIEFAIDVVRGPTFHLGQIDGSAEVSDASVEYRVKPEPDWDETVISFSRDGPFLVVVGTNTQYFHGARAWFDGRYLRLGATAPVVD